MAATLAVPLLLLSHCINYLHNRSIELKLMGHHRVDVIPAFMGVEVYQGCTPSPFGVTLSGTCPPLTIKCDVGLSCSAMLITEGTEEVGVPLRL